MSDKYILPVYVTEILNLFYQNGYEAYVVGGSVRDIILGKSPDDYDITTNALPENVIEICKNKYKTVETGIKHGTVTVVSHNNNLEITTYRVDGEYSDGRRPDSVAFTPNLNDDLKRRDFTINALVLNQDGCVNDYFYGIGDINKKIVRSIGKATDRFNEDALRILRALRFSAVLGFSIDEETSSAIHSEKHLLNKVSSERIFSELKKMFRTSHKDVLIKVLSEYSDVFSVILKIACSNEEYLKYGEKLQKITDADELNFIYYLCAISDFSIDILKKNLENLKVSNSFKNKTLAVNEILDMPKETLFDAKMIIRRFGIEYAKAAAEILLSIESQNNLLKHLEKIVDSKCCVSINMLDVDGNDIRDRFNVTGRELGDFLEILLIAVMKNEVENTKKDLLEYLSEIINKNQ